MANIPVSNVTLEKNVNRNGVFAISCNFRKAKCIKYFVGLGCFVDLRSIRN